jgi:hypothetical protein
MGVLASNRRQQRAQPRAPLLTLAPLRPPRPAALTLDLALTLTPPNGIHMMSKKIPQQQNIPPQQRKAGGWSKSKSKIKSKKRGRG